MALIRWKGSMLKLAFARPTWLLWVFLHVVGLILVRTVLVDGPLDENEPEKSALRLRYQYVEIPYTTVGVLSSLMSFSLVFFGSHCYKRFYAMYGATMGMIDTLKVCSLQLGVLLKEDAAWNVIRYATASAMILFAKVSSQGDGSKNKVGQVIEEDWDRLTQSEAAWLGEAVMAETHNGKVPVSCPALLTREEVEILQSVPADLHTLTCQGWAMREIKRDGTLQGPVLTSVFANAI